MPSNPILQACWNTVRPQSCCRCSFSRTPWPALPQDARQRGLAHLDRALGVRHRRFSRVIFHKARLTTASENTYVSSRIDVALNLAQHVVTFRAEFNLFSVDRAPVLTQIAETNPRELHRKGWTLFR